MPALLTRMSSAPKRRSRSESAGRLRRSRPSRSSRRPRRRPAGSRRRPRPRCASRPCRRCSTPRSLTTTFAPSCANISAISRPMPAPSTRDDCDLPRKHAHRCPPSCACTQPQRGGARRRLRTAQKNGDRKSCRRLNARGAARVAGRRGKPGASRSSGQRRSPGCGGIDTAAGGRRARLRGLRRWRRSRSRRPEVRRPRHRGHLALHRLRHRALRTQRWRPWIGLGRVAPNRRTSADPHPRDRAQGRAQGRVGFRGGLRRALLSPLVAQRVAARTILGVVAAERLHVLLHRGAFEALARTEGRHGLQPFGWHGVRDAAGIDGLARVPHDVEQLDRRAVLCLGSAKRHATVLHVFGDEHTVLGDRGLGYGVERPPRAFFEDSSSVLPSSRTR